MPTCPDPQVADSLAAARNQMLGRQSANGTIIRANKAGPYPPNRTIDQNIWSLALMHTLEQIQLPERLRGSDDQAIDLPGKQ